jgi:hypothetical protein
VKFQSIQAKQFFVIPKFDKNLGCYNHNSKNQESLCNLLFVIHSCLFELHMNNGLVDISILAGCLFLLENQGNTSDSEVFSSKSALL